MNNCTCHPKVCDIIGHFEAVGHSLEILLQQIRCRMLFIIYKY